MWTWHWGWNKPASAVATYNGYIQGCIFSQWPQTGVHIFTVASNRGVHSYNGHNDPACEWTHYKSCLVLTCNHCKKRNRVDENWCVWLSDLIDNVLIHVHGHSGHCGHHYNTPCIWVTWLSLKGFVWAIKNIKQNITLLLYNNIYIYMTNRFICSFIILLLSASMICTKPFAREMRSFLE